MDAATQPWDSGGAIIVAMLVGGTRALGLIAIFPLFSIFSVVGLLSIFFSLGVSLPAIFTAYTHIVDHNVSLFHLSELALKEYCVGYLLGLVLGFPFWAAQAAGDITDAYAGTNQANIFDQINALETTPLGSILLTATLALFVTMGGLLDLLALFYRSYAFWPMLDLGPRFDGDGLGLFLDMFGQLFRTGALLALPLVLLLGATELIVGFLAKSSRQFPLSGESQLYKMLVLLGAFVLYVGFIPTYVKDIWAGEVKTVTQVLESTRGQR